MHLTDEQKHQMELYGRLLAGTETELELAKLARTHYLKTKMRPALAAQIGDYGDNITDTTRALVLGEAIRLGLVDDFPAAIDGYTAYVATMLEGYGGAEAILSVLQANVSALGSILVGKYYAAKAAIEAAETVEDVQAVYVEQRLSEE